MAKILVGDFRSAALKAFASKNDYAYLIEDGANSRWFKDMASKQLSSIVAENDSVIIAIGFNDCVNCCAFEYLSVDNCATTISNAVNTLINTYKNATFYVCSVNPVSSDYATSLLDSGFIDRDTLNTKIKQFNSKIQSACKATFLDTYTYLAATNFSTIDGVRFTNETCTCLFAYYTTHLNLISGASFEARTKAPIVQTGNIDIDIYWLGEKYGGLNPFYDLGQENAKCKEDTLPNCTAYAWGRFYEILGQKPTLSTGNAEQWFINSSDGYQRGQEPALGAIMCWQRGATTLPDGNDGAGHVAIVEKINSDGSVVTSESGWGDSRYWWSSTRSKGTNGNWGMGSSYTFQGFIYCPNVSTSTGAVGDYISKSQIISKNTYLKRSEMEINARYIWGYLGAKGWTLSAVAALLGNLQAESTMSTSRCEGSNIVARPVGGDQPTPAAIEDYAYRYKAAHGRFPGYGLVQWTETSSKLTDWNDHRLLKWCRANNLDPADMDGQLARIVWESGRGSEWWTIASYNRGYTFRGESLDSITFKEFTTSNKDPGWLAAVWAFCYEKPAGSDNKLSNAERKAGYKSAAEAKLGLCETRAGFAESWYSFLSGLPTIAITATEECMQFENLKIDCCLSTSVDVSFLASKAETATYTLKQGNTVKTERAIKINNDFTTFKLSGLIPNTNYGLTVTVQDEHTSNEKNILFKTQQELPEPFSTIKLSTTDSKLPYNNFKLSVSPSSPDFGYWENNGNGYAIQLIVNGRLRSEREISSLPKTIKLSDYFKYTTKLGDIIQIGIRTWVESNDGKIYDNDFAKVSNPICMLAKPVMAYLNK